MAWDPQLETYVEYLTRTGGGDATDTAQVQEEAAAPAPGTLSSPLTTLSQDPGFVAFLRTSGLTSRLASADAAKQRLALNQALGLDRADIAAAGKRERRNISGGQESRGTFRSGQHLTQLAEQEGREARQRGRQELATATGLGDVESQLLQKVAGQQVLGGEKGLETADNQYLDSELNRRGL